MAENVEGGARGGMDEDSGSRLNIIVMRGPESSGYAVAVSRAFAIAVGIAAVAAIGLNIYLASVYLTLKAGVESGKIGPAKTTRNDILMENRVRDLEGDVMALAREMRDLRKLSERVGEKVNTLFLDDYIETPGDAGSDPRGQYLPPLDEMQAQLVSMRGEILKHRDFLDEVEKQVDLAANETDRVPQLPPLKTMRVSSPIGFRIHPISGFIEFHSGVDLKAAAGESVYSSGKGKVVFAGAAGNYGLCVIVDHGNGYRTRYAHLSAYDVQRGQSVRKGELIGLAGSTGYSTGPHLHFEITYKGRLIDPVAFMSMNIDEI